MVCQSAVGESRFMTWSDPPPAFASYCRRLGVPVDAALQARLGEYLEALREANRACNLTAIRDAESAWLRHIADSLSVAPRLAPGEALVDIGSGAGLPGVVLALADPTRSVTLLEATGKKCRFLEATAARFGLERVVVLHLRAEEAGRDARYREGFDVAVARAVADLPVLLELAAPLVRIGGRVLAMKGQGAADEMRRADAARDLLGLATPTTHTPFPDLHPDACLLVYAKERPTPAKYPRRPGIPAKRPLREGGAGAKVNSEQ
jgi:16S rRNA (guanine527-N7)-methyltransferase